MCRNIKRLGHADHPPTDQELHDAALQSSSARSGSRWPCDAAHSRVRPSAPQSGACMESKRWKKCSGR